MDIIGYIFLFAILLVYSICVKSITLISSTLGLSYEACSVFLCEYATPVVGIIFCILPIVLTIVKIYNYKIKINIWLIGIILNTIYLLMCLFDRFNLLVNNIQLYHGKNNQEIYKEAYDNIMLKSKMMFTTYEIMYVSYYTVPLFAILFCCLIQFLLTKRYVKTLKHRL